MTSNLFIDQFNILYNSITSNLAPGLDAYEMSTFLTIAQDQIVLAYFSPKQNKVMEGFDDSKIRLYDFSTLVKVATLSSAENTNPLFTSSSNLFIIPTNAFIILNERLKYGSSTTPQYKTVIPISYREYDNFMQKPSPKPPKKLIWRIVTGISDTGQTYVELIGTENLSNVSYSMRYVKKPKPIDLATDDTADTDTPCELPEEVQRDILLRAVELAKASYLGDLSTLIGIGSSSQTELGYIPQNNTRQ